MPENAPMGRISILGLAFLMLASLAPASHAAKPDKDKIPLILNAVPDGSELIIQGADIAQPPTEPVVTLNGIVLVVNSFTDVEIRAALPSPALDPGTYLLTVDPDNDGKNLGVSDVTIGSITSVDAGLGLLGGGTSGDVTVDADFAGTGVADTVARSDHDHTGEDIVTADPTTEQT